MLAGIRRLYCYCIFKTTSVGNKEDGVSGRYVDTAGRRPGWLQRRAVTSDGDTLSSLDGAAA